MKGKTSSDTKQFLLTLLATTISIILTFGTSAIIDRRHKEASKKEMVLMIIYDFDKTIEQVQYADSLFHQAFKTQQEIARHPELFGSYCFAFNEPVKLIYKEFSETTERVFSSNIETFNTLGNVNFIHEVSEFYNLRRFYQETVLDEFEKEVVDLGMLQSIEKLLRVSFPEYYLSCANNLMIMRRIRNRCVQMMGISEDDIREFSQQRFEVGENVEDSVVNQLSLQEYLEAENALSEAIEKLEQDKQESQK